MLAFHGLSWLFAYATGPLRKLFHRLSFVLRTGRAGGYDMWFRARSR